MTSLTSHGYHLVQAGQIVKVFFPDGHCVDIIYAQKLTEETAKYIIIKAGATS